MAWLDDRSCESSFPLFALCVLAGAFYLVLLLLPFQFQPSLLGSPLMLNLTSLWRSSCSARHCAVSSSGGDRYAPGLHLTMRFKALLNEAKGSNQRLADSGSSQASLERTCLPYPQGEAGPGYARPPVGLRSPEARGRYAHA